MIQLKQIAEMLENGLNNIFDNPELQFKVWALTGEHKRAIREGNKVTYFINGNLRMSSSSNEANIIPMGVSGLTLDFLIPVAPPRTGTEKLQEQLYKFTQPDEQYRFPMLITSVIDKYFQEQKTFTMKDEDGEEYSMSFIAGTAISGMRDMKPIVGDSVEVSVYIDVYFIRGGVMSKDVQLEVDGSLVPYSMLTFGRVNVMERDVYTKALSSKGITSSSAISIDVQFPANSDTATREAILHLMHGEPNTVHFVKLKYGKDASGNDNDVLYLMTYENTKTTAQGISIATVSAAFVEAVGNCELLNAPTNYQIGRFIFNSSASTPVTFTLDKNCKAFFAGKAREWTAATYTITLTPDNFEWSKIAGGYCAYLITDKAVSVTDTSAPFEVIKEAKNG